VVGEDTHHARKHHLSPCAVGVLTYRVHWEHITTWLARAPATHDIDPMLPPLHPRSTNRCDGAVDQRQVGSPDATLNRSTLSSCARWVSSPTAFIGSTSQRGWRVRSRTHFTFCGGRFPCVVGVLTHHVFGQPGKNFPKIPSFALTIAQRVVPLCRAHVNGYAQSESQKDSGTANLLYWNNRSITKRTLMGSSCFAVCRNR
jgi:hypothetical protein